MKRYDCTPQGMADHTWGYWVRHEDVADIQRQLAKAIAQRDKYGAMIDESQDQLEKVLDKAEEQQRQLAEVTRERDTLKAMVELHDALNDRRRAIAYNERRTIRGR